MRGGRRQATPHDDAPDRIGGVVTTNHRRNRTKRRGQHSTPPVAPQLSLHPITTLFPAMPAEDFERLKGDIRAHGQQAPIVTTAVSRHSYRGPENGRALRKARKLHTGLANVLTLSQLETLLARTSISSIARRGRTDWPTRPRALDHNHHGHHNNRGASHADLRQSASRQPPASLGRHLSRNRH